MSYQVHLMSNRLISVTQYSLRVVERPAKNWSPWFSLFPHPRLLRCERQFYIWYHADSWTFTKEVNLGPVNISGPLRKPYRTLAFCLHMKRCRSDAIWPVPDRCVCRDTSMVFAMAKKPIQHGFSNAQPYRRQPHSVRSFALFNWFWNVLSWMVIDIQAETQSQKASAFNVFPHALCWHLLRTILYSTWQAIPYLMHNIAVQGINQNLAILFGAYCILCKTKRNEMT